MMYCKVCIEELKLMNFNTESEIRVRDRLLRALERYLIQQGEIDSTWKHNWSDVNWNEIEEENTFDREFITVFARFFRNSSHLSKFISDAPMLHAIEIKLYVAVLLPLDPVIQEAQLMRLSLLELQRVIRQAVVAYEGNLDPEQCSDYQHLAQLALFELVRRHCSQIQCEEATHDYVAYQQFLRDLEAAIEDVKESTIFDNSSDHKSTNGQSISALLAQVESIFLGDEPLPWTTEANEVRLCKAGLLHKLRFGQDDRREYVRKRAEALGKDLFWARGIRNVELFMGSSIADMHFRELAERRYFLNSDHPYQLSAKAKQFKNTCWGKFYSVLSNYKTQMMPPTAALKPKNNSMSPSSMAKQRPKPTPSKQSKLGMTENGAITALLRQELGKPLVHYSPRNQPAFTVTFFDILGEASDIAQILMSAVRINGGLLGSDIDSLVRSLTKSSAAPLEKVTLFQLSGASLEEIHAALSTSASIEARAGAGGDHETLSVGSFSSESIERTMISPRGKNAPTRHATTFLQQLKNIGDEVGSKEKTSIKGLNLNSNDELRLRKLLELHVFSVQYRGEPIPAVQILSPAFMMLMDGHYDEVLKIPELDLEISNAYMAIADVQMQDEMGSFLLQKILYKASLLASDEAERTTKLNALDKIVHSNMPSTQREATLVALFNEEYEEMRATLCFSDDEKAKLKEDLGLLATEFVRLDERVRRGEPALTKVEQQTVFITINQVWAQLGNTDSFYAARFKIPHSCVGETAIKVRYKNGHQAVVTVSIASPLPYAIVKPPQTADNVFFSYGGSRGIVAPFEGFSQAYSTLLQPKRRFFTNWRLLGVGQSGSVKALEHVVSGLHAAVKKGYVVRPQGYYSTFKESARQALRTRAITSRNAPLSRVESEVIKQFAHALRLEESAAVQIQYWHTQDKERPEGSMLFNSTSSEQYRLLMPRAKGDTYADSVNQVLNRYSKNNRCYHDPIERGDGVHALTELVHMAESIVNAAQAFEALGFVHNDLKPENIVCLKGPNGGYSVYFIDWETGSYERPYLGRASDLKAIFKEVFGEDIAITHYEEGGERCEGEHGRFVKRLGTSGSVIHGIHAHLDILDGARHGTVPYISPKILPSLSDVADIASLAIESLRSTMEPRPASRPQSRKRRVGSGKSSMTELGATPMLQTITISANDTRMDDWALMVMVFGLCHRETYFRVVKGRIISDYEIPGILESDGGAPRGLRVVDPASFEAFFGGIEPAVMYVPSNQREGEPLHLYRRLIALKKLCPERSEISQQIDAILTRVREATVSGEGMSKKELYSLLGLAKRCIRNVQLLGNTEHEQRLSYSERVQRFIEVPPAPDELISRLKDRPDAEHSNLELLCLYSDKMQQDAVLTILDDVSFDAFRSNCFDLEDDKSYGAWYFLFVDAIGAHQEAILCHLLKKIDRPSHEFIKLVRTQGLVHYALQEGLTQVAKALLTALEQAGVSLSERVSLLFQTYTEKERSYIHWSSNAFHVAIRNGDNAQLQCLLQQWDGIEQELDIKGILYWCAFYANAPAFQMVLETYNTQYVTKPILPGDLLSYRHPPKQVSTYHLFLEDEMALEGIPWSLLEENETFAKSFLLVAPEHTFAYPWLIAAEKANCKGLERLFKLIQGHSWSLEDVKTLFLQKDAKNKGILHYLLERELFTLLPSFFKTLTDIIPSPEERYKVLMDLLDSYHPQSPLRLFLAPEVSPEMSYPVMHLILDQLCTKPQATMPICEQNRLDVLLANQSWLLHEATQGRAKEIGELVEKDALSRRSQCVLFQALARVEDAPFLYRSLLNKNRTMRATPSAEDAAHNRSTQSAEMAQTADEVHGLFETFSLDFLKTFAATNSTGIQLMKIEIQTLLAKKETADHEKFAVLSQKMQAIATERTQGFAHFWSRSGFLRGGRASTVNALYQQMRQPTFSILTDYAILINLLKNHAENGSQSHGMARFFSCHKQRSKEQKPEDIGMFKRK